MSNELQRRSSNRLPALFDGFSDMTKWADRLFEEIESRFTDTGLLRGVSREHPRIDLSEDADNVYVDAAVPGWSKDDIQLSIEPGSLTLQGMRSEEHQTADAERKYVSRCIASRNFSRQLKLPDVDVQNATADLRDGILRVVLPKLESDKPQVRKIDIN